MKNDRDGLDLLGLTVFLPGWAEQDQRRLAPGKIHGDGSASARSDDYIRLMEIELGLSGAKRNVEVVVVQGRIDDLVAMLSEKGWLHAARNGPPAMQEENFHAALLCLPTGKATV